MWGFEGSIRAPRPARGLDRFFTRPRHRSENPARGRPPPLLACALAPSRRSPAITLLPNVARTPVRPCPVPAPRHALRDAVARNERPLPCEPLAASGRTALSICCLVQTLNPWPLDRGGAARSLKRQLVGCTYTRARVWGVAGLAKGKVHTGKRRTARWRERSGPPAAHALVGSSRGRGGGPPPAAPLLSASLLL